MPVEVKKMRGLYRVVEQANGRLARHAGTGTVLDGGGHRDAATAGRQVGYINDAWEKKHGTTPWAKKRATPRRRTRRRR